MGAAVGASARALGAAAGAAAGVRRRGRPRDGQTAGGALPLGRRPRARRPRRGRGDDVHRAGGLGRTRRGGAGRVLDPDRRGGTTTATPTPARVDRRRRRRRAGRRGRDRRAGHPGRRAAPRPTPTPPSATATPPFTTQTTERIGDRPNAIARVGDELWVGSANSQWLTLVSAESGKELADHVQVGADIRALVAYRDDLWLARGSTKEVVRVDARTRRIVAELPVPGTPTSLAVADSGIWVAVSDDDGRATLLRYDRRSRALRQSIAVREGIGGIVAAGGVVWVVKAATNKLSRIESGRRPPHGLGVAARRGRQHRLRRRRTVADDAGRGRGREGGGPHGPQRRRLGRARAGRRGGRRRARLRVQPQRPHGRRARARGAARRRRADRGRPEPFRAWPPTAARSG